MVKLQCKYCEKSFDGDAYGFIDLTYHEIDCDYKPQSNDYKI